MNSTGADQASAADRPREAHRGDLARAGGGERVTTGAESGARRDDVVDEKHPLRGLAIDVDPTGRSGPPFGAVAADLGDGGARADEAGEHRQPRAVARPRPRSRPPGCSRVTAAAAGATGRGRECDRAASGAGSRSPGGAFATICAAIASASADRAAELQRADEVAGRAGVGERRPDAHAGQQHRLGPPAGGAPRGSLRRAGRRGATGPSRTSRPAARAARPGTCRWLLPPPSAEDFGMCATPGRRVATIPSRWSTRGFTGWRTRPSSHRSSCWWSSTCAASCRCGARTGRGARRGLHALAFAGRDPRPARRARLPHRRAR